MKNIKITLHKEEMMSDIVSTAHITGRRLSAPGVEEKAADIQTPEDGPDKYIVARAMSTGLSNIRVKCARYLASGRLSDNDSLEDIKGDYVLELNMPDRWNFAATAKLTSVMHNHVVDYCIYSIFEKTNPQEASNYMAKANTEIEEIKGILELRTAPVRRSANKLY